MLHIIGFGNDLHGDDGFAAMVCLRLNALPLAANVRVFDAGTRGLDALALLKDCDEAILLDAHQPRWPRPSPGRVAELPLTSVALPQDPSGHAGGVAWVLEALRHIEPNPPKIRLITAEVGVLRAFTPGLSTPMEHAVEQVVAMLSREVLHHA